MVSPSASLPPTGRRPGVSALHQVQRSSFCSHVLLVSSTLPLCSRIVECVAVAFSTCFNLQPKQSTPPLARHQPPAAAQLRHGSPASSMGPAPSLRSHGSSAMPQPGTADSAAHPSPPPHMQVQQGE